MRWLRGLSALTALGLVLVGAPIALFGWGRYPADWPAALTRPDDGSVLLVVLTVVGWLAWAAFAASTAVEAIRLLSHASGRRRLPLLGGLQHVSSWLLLAVLALAPGTAPDPVATAGLSLRADPEPEEIEPVSGVPAEPQGAGYQVQAGDELWTVSERLLGNGSRWRELVAANPELLREPTAPLTPGTRIAVPSSSAAAPLRVTVERGDTLSALALDHLGAAGRWPRIAAANAELISDPDHIEVGWRLTIPGVSGAASNDAPEPKRPAKADPDSREDRSGGGSAGSQPADPTQQPSAQAAAPPTDPTQQPSAQAAAPPTNQPAAAGEPEAQSVDLPLLGALGTLAAAAILGAMETRRYLRLRERPIGRRLVPPDDQTARLRAAMGTRQRPDRLAVLDSAMRAIGRHCHQQHVPPPTLDRITVGEAELAFHWAEPAGPPPPGFSAKEGRWTVPLAGSSPFSAGEHPCPYPAVVSLGSTESGDIVLVDAEKSRVLGISADADELRRATLAAIGVELACASWSQELRLVVVGGDSRLVSLAGGDRVQRQPSVEDGLTHLRQLVGRRRAALAGEPLWKLRIDPDRAEAVAPMVFLFLADVSLRDAAVLDEVLAGPPAGVAAIVATESGAPAQWQVAGDPYSPRGHLAGAADSLLAHSVPEATRAGVTALLRTADDPATLPAPWWDGRDGNVLALPQRAHQGEDQVDIARLLPPTEHPRVLLIGPTELTGAPGPAPSRSRQQLIELCAWLLEHPGSTATAMASALAVAEGTRRSNLSRLRNWLGNTSDAQPYLPDAYSGRILLHPAVSSDWHRLQLLIKPGIDRVGDSTLIAALELVRGAPLADAAPGQWHWAEELRTDISSALRDTGLVLTQRALARGDIELARWAAARALVVAPEDEQLLGARIRTEHRAGNTPDVERLVNQVARQARILGVDLLPETVLLCQQVIEGRPRARRA